VYSTRAKRLAYALPSTASTRRSTSISPTFKGNLPGTAFVSLSFSWVRRPTCGGAFDPFDVLAPRRTGLSDFQLLWRVVPSRDLLQVVLAL
jgi:hypothetical protein